MVEYKHRTYLETADLDGYFRAHPTPNEDLLEKATQLCTCYMSMEAYERALDGDIEAAVQDFFVIGAPWTVQGGMLRTIEGDQVLANSILRMRDSILHYEFQCAVSDGDIGRAMNVMAVSEHIIRQTKRCTY